jgi:hypothetical protein
MPKDKMPEPSETQDQGDGFKSEESKARVLADLAKERAEKKALADQVAALQAKVDAADKSKSEVDKLQEKLAELEKRYAESEQKVLRNEVAQAKGLTPAQARRLQGTTREALEADADDLLAAFQPAEGGDDDEDEDKAAGRRQRPRERLRPGATSDTEPEETDPVKLAAKVPRMY